MPLDLSKLSDAVTQVAGVAKRAARAENDIREAQASVDTLTAALLAAVSTPAEAVGIAAVAAALTPETPAVATMPVMVDPD